MRPPALPTVLVLTAAFLLGGCTAISRHVDLSYETMGIVSDIGARQTTLSVTPFLDERHDRNTLGYAVWAGPLLPVPLRTDSDVAAWATQAAVQELRAAGYKVLEGSAWKVGGAVDAAACGRGAGRRCVVELDLWVRSGDNAQVMKRRYDGESWRKSLLPQEDPYALSLQEALHKTLSDFVRDAETMIP